MPGSDTYDRAISAVLRRAQEIVRAAGLPAELQAVAFGKVCELLLDDLVLGREEG